MAIAGVLRRLCKLPSWALLLVLLIAVSSLVRFLPHSFKGPPEGQQTNDAKAGERQTTLTPNPANQAAPQTTQTTPAETFALALRETLQAKYSDIDVGVVNHVLSLISDSFRDGTRRESQAKELLKNRLCTRIRKSMQLAWVSESRGGSGFRG